MAQRPEDVYLENFTSRNLGTAPIAGRAIQQLNLPELGKALATANMTRSNLQSERENQMRINAMHRYSLPNVASRLASRLSGSPDVGIVRLLHNPIAQGASTGTAMGGSVDRKGYALTYADQAGVKKSLSFANIGGLQEFAKRRNMKLALTGNPILDRSDALLRELKRGNISRIGVADALDLTKGWAQLSIKPLLQLGKIGGLRSTTTGFTNDGKGN